VLQNQRLLGEISTEAKKVYACRNDVFLQKLGADEKFHAFFHAPTVIVVSGEADFIAPDSDCAVAAQNMMLAAEALHIGSCWVSAVRVLLQTEEGRKLVHALKLPEGYVPFNSIALGYKKADNSQAAPRREGTVSYIE
jgi:nitroreductase